MGTWEWRVDTRFEQQRSGGARAHHPNRSVQHSTTQSVSVSQCMQRVQAKGTECEREVVVVVVVVVVVSRGEGGAGSGGRGVADAYLQCFDSGLNRAHRVLRRQRLRLRLLCASTALTRLWRSGVMCSAAQQIPNTQRFTLPPLDAACGRALSIRAGRGTAPRRTTQRRAGAGGGRAGGRGNRRK
jgi:hypothetical protein